MRRATAAILLFIATSAFAAAPNVDDRVEQLLRRMTLDEKIGQLLQYTASEKDIESIVAKGAVGSIFGIGGEHAPSGAVQTNALQRAAMERSRLKIPILFGHDIIHGCRTIFPIPIGIASTWDPAAAELAARIAAREASAMGIRWTFAPMVDIARDPRWGRIAEGAGEDPLLGAAMAAAYVRGYQGNDLSAPDSIAACAKHFAAYGAAEAGRDYNSADMSERTLREVYLPPFKAAVDAGARTLMSAFDALNGVPASANPFLLKKVLRSEWGFRGFVVSDWTAVRELMNHGVAATPDQAALKAITAGVDMDMVDATYATLAAAVKEGRLDEHVIDDAVRRVLRVKFELGLFERPYVDEKREQVVALTKEHRAAARRIAGESIVLLRNDGGLLPLSNEMRSIALIGPLADSREDMLGSWYGHGKASEAVSVREGIASKLGGDVRIAFASGGTTESATDEEIAAAVEAARGADVAVVVVGEPGEMSGEANSRASLDLSGRQQQLLEAVVAAGKPVVLVVMSGRPLTIAWAAAHVPAIVWAWFPGTEGGNAVADVLFGDVNPSGKLPVSIPRSVGQIPIYYAHLPTGRPEDPADKFTSRYVDSPNDPLFAFGQGLSYTKFDYSDLRVGRGERGSFRISAAIRNGGERAGDEVVQLYVHQRVASVSRPVKQLKAFSRISLAPGQTRRVEFTIGRDDVRYWSDRGWVVEPGTFDVWIGPDSTTGLHGTFEVK